MQRRIQDTLRNSADAPCARDWGQIIYAVSACAGVYPEVNPKRKPNYCVCVCLCGLLRVLSPACDN